MWIELNGCKFRIREQIGNDKITIGGPYSTRQEAEQALTLLMAEAIRGESLALNGGKVTINELIDMWWPTHERGMVMTARASEGSRIRHHIRPLLGHLMLDEIDSKIVNQWIDDLEKGVGPMGEPDPGHRRPPKRRPLSPKTVANVHGILYSMMNYAVRAKLIRLNPCAGSVLPPRILREMRCLTDEEIARLLDAMPEYWRPLALLIVMTGLRWGEAVGLKVGRVHLYGRKPFLRVEEQLQKERPSGRLVFVPPKSDRSRRTVAFDRAVAVALRPLVAGKTPDQVVFTTPAGKLVRDHDFRPVWVEACDAAGLSGLRVHDLRHTHAGMLLSAGVSLEKVSRRLGHASVEITDRVYGHMRPNADEDVMAAVRESVRAIGLDPEVESELSDEFDEAA